MDICSQDSKELDDEVIVGLLVTLTVIGGPLILFSFLRSLSTDQNQVSTVLKCTFNQFQDLNWEELHQENITGFRRLSHFSVRTSIRYRQKAGKKPKGQMYRSQSLYQCLQRSNRSDNFFSTPNLSRQ